MSNETLIDQFYQQAVEKNRYFLFPELTDEPFQLLSGGLEKCRVGYEVKRDNFPYFGIELVLGGKGIFRVGGIEYTLSRGSLFCYTPYSKCVIISDDQDPLEKTFLDFKGDEIISNLSASGLLPQNCISCWSFAEVWELFRLIVRNGLQVEEENRRACTLLSQALFEKLSQHHRRRTNLGVGGRGAFQTWEKAVRYMEEHYLSMMHVQEVADVLEVSPAYLSRLFKRFRSESPKRYLLHLKMNHAGLRLGRDRLPVKQVALELNYVDQWQFSKVF